MKQRLSSMTIPGNSNYRIDRDMAKTIIKANVHNKTLKQMGVMIGASHTTVKKILAEMGMEAQREYRSDLMQKEMTETFDIDLYAKQLVHI